mgnify:CR=1 FL=1
MSTQDVQKGQTDDPEFEEVRAAVLTLHRRVKTEHGREAARVLVDLAEAFLFGRIDREEFQALAEPLVLRGEHEHVTARLAELAG